MSYPVRSAPVAEAKDDQRPGTAAASRRPRFAQRFVVIYHEGDDVQGVRFDSGHVLADVGAGDDFVTASCIHHLVQELTDGRRATVVWECDTPPVQCCPEGEH